MKHLLINVNSIVNYSGRTHLSGIDRSTLGIIRELTLFETLPFQLTLFYQRIKSGGLSKYDLPFNTLRIPLPNKAFFSRAINILSLKEILTGYDLYHIPHNTDFVKIPSKTIFTIHDLMIYKFPEFFPFTTEWERKMIKLINNCKAVVTCSESSKNDISYFWKISDEKIRVIRWGIDRSVFFPSPLGEIDQIIKTFHLRPFFLVVSCDHPRKNVNLSLKAFRLFINFNKEYQLVLVWNKPPDYILKEYKKEIESDFIKFLPNLSDNELRVLYSAAKATIFTSLYEGFGFPLLESLACHTPVITCNNSSLSEVGGDNVIYTSESDPEELAENMKKIANSNVIDSEFIEKTEKHLQKFSWKVTAEEYIKFYTDQLN